MNIHFSRRAVAVLALALLGPAGSFAQTTDGGPDPNAVRLRLGPLWLNPTISMPNVGIDTNVFNDPPSRAPKEDFTVTLAPKTDLWLRMGRTWLSGLIAGDIVWYQKYETERSVNSTYQIGWKAPLNRLVLATTATWVSTHARPGFEIDARAERKEPAYGGSFEIRGFAKTFIGVRGNWKQVRFDESAVYDGRSLKDELDRTSTAAAFTLRHQLTPLTSLTVGVGRSEERFKTTTTRDSLSDDFSIGLAFDPAALIKGGATVGYTWYKPTAPDLPGFTGTTANVNLTYTVLGSTRLTAGLMRNIEFSYDVDEPYYVLTGGTGSIAQQVFGPVDVVARIGAQRLHYQSRVGAVVIAPNRTDRVRLFGVGVGFHMGDDLRLGFNIDKERRTSVLPDRDYEGLKYGSSVTYGL